MIRRTRHDARRWRLALPVLAALFAAVWLSPAGCAPGEDRDADDGGAAASLQRAIALADTWLEQVPPERSGWSWGDGVLMYGLTRLQDRTGDPRYTDYVQRYVEHHLERGYYFAYNDHCIPAKAALWLARKTGDGRYLEPIDGFEHYIYEFAARLSDGSINHMGWLSDSAIWMDSLFMIGPLLLDLYEMTGDERHLYEIRDQIMSFSRHLRDPGHHLWRHRWDEATQARTPQAPHFWARGNGWVLATLGDFLNRAPADVEGYEAIAEDFRTLAAAVASWQQDSGLWSTVLNHPDESYVESSSAALFLAGFAMGVRAGQLDGEYLDRARRAMSALGRRIHMDRPGVAVFPATSLGTSPGDLACYNEVLVADNVNYGVGAYLLAVTEVYR